MHPLPSSDRNVFRLSASSGPLHQSLKRFFDEQATNVRDGGLRRLGLSRQVVVEHRDSVRIASMDDSQLSTW